MHNRRNNDNFARVGLVRAGTVSQALPSSDDDDDGMKFTSPPLFHFPDNGNPASRSGWDEEDSGEVVRVGYLRVVDPAEEREEVFAEFARAIDISAEKEWGHTESEQVVRSGYAEVVALPQDERSSSRTAVDDWGYTREKNYGWDLPQTWASPSTANRAGDEQWTTPEWSASNNADEWTRVTGKEKNPNKSAKDDRYISYDGEPAVVETKEEVDAWCDVIWESGVTVLGFDTEWKPERMRGQDNTIALIQFCFRTVNELNEISHQVVLIHSIQTGMTEKLKAILEDPKIIKAGVDLTCDRRKLQNHFGVTLNRGMDLDLEYSKMVNDGKSKKNQRVGMKRLVKLVLGLEMKKPKSIQTVNWERPLTYASIQYGALDAYVCSRVYEKLFES